MGEDDIVFPRFFPKPCVFVLGPKLPKERNGSQPLLCILGTYVWR